MGERNPADAMDMRTSDDVFEFGDYSESSRGDYL